MRAPTPAHMLKAWQALLAVEGTLLWNVLDSERVFYVLQATEHGILAWRGSLMGSCDYRHFQLDTEAPCLGVRPRLGREQMGVHGCTPALATPGPGFLKRRRRRRRYLFGHARVVAEHIQRSGAILSHARISAHDFGSLERILGPRRG